LRLDGNDVGAAAELTPIGVKRMSGKKELHGAAPSISHGIIKPVSRTNQGKGKAFRAPARHLVHQQRGAVLASLIQGNPNMIKDSCGNIDYDVSGAGPTMVLVPGSCSTGAAWRPVIASLGGKFRCATTSLPGYGGTAERRPADDPSIAYLAKAVECVVRKAGEPAHLVGHSFGGLVSLAVALRKRVRLASLTMIEPPAIRLLSTNGENAHHRAFARMTESYFAAVRDGQPDAIAAMIDFYGGAGTFALWPPRVRDYAMATTAVNITDWASARGLALSADVLSAIDIPALVVCGESSHPAMRRLCALVSECIGGGHHATIDGAAHFMIATHPSEVARVVAGHAQRAEAIDIAPAKTVKFSGQNHDVLNDIGLARRHGGRASIEIVEPFSHS
jgi:pimeloyl-ACP methyl ester carboxylesterase